MISLLNTTSSLASTVVMPLFLGSSKRVMERGSRS